MDWNEEGTDEQGGAESPQVANDNASAQNSEKKEENVGAAAEENEWDKLLRVRSVALSALYVSLHFYVSVNPFNFLFIGGSLFVVGKDMLDAFRKHL